jgi:hypothetical protein
MAVGIMVGRGLLLMIMVLMVIIFLGQNSGTIKN